MSKEEEKTKPLPGLNDWVKSQYIGNIIRLIINVIILPGLVFWVVGYSLNNQVGWLQGFLFVFFTMVPLICLNDAVVDSKAAYLQGKWEMKIGEGTDRVEMPTNHWRRVAISLILGIIFALIGYGALRIFIRVSGNNIFPLSAISVLIMTIVIVSFPIWIITHYWIKYHLANELSSFTASLSRPKQEKPEPFFQYFMLEHALPWMLILGILNLIINFKGFSENAFADGIILTEDVLFSVWITTLVLVYWMFASAQTQVRADVHLGRVQKGRALPAWLLILFAIMVPFAGAAIFYLPALLIGITQFSIFISTLIIIIDAIISAIIGRLIGIWWGKTREFRQLQKE